MVLPSVCASCLRDIGCGCISVVLQVEHDELLGAALHDEDLHKQLKKFLRNVPGEETQIVELIVQLVVAGKAGKLRVLAAHLIAELAFAIDVLLPKKIKLYANPLDVRAMPTQLEGKKRRQDGYMSDMLAEGKGRTNNKAGPSANPTQFAKNASSLLGVHNFNVLNRHGLQLIRYLDVARKWFRTTQHLMVSTDASRVSGRDCLMTVIGGMDASKRTRVAWAPPKDRGSAIDSK